MTARINAGPGVLASVALVAVVLAVASWQVPWLALGAASAAALLALTLARADLLLLVLTAALPWEGLLAFPTETVTVVKLLGLLLFVAFVVRAAGGQESLRFPPTLIPVLALGLLVGVSLMFSPDPNAGVSKTLRYVLFITFFFLIVQLVRDRRAVIRAVRVITISATVAAAVGVVSFLSGDQKRATGPISDPNDFAYLIASVLPLAAFLFAQERSRRPLWALASIVLVSGMLATLSRGAIVGLGALAVWAIVTRRVRIGGLTAGILGAGLALLLAFSFYGPLIQEGLDGKGKVASSNISSRQFYWTAALRMAAERPLTGVGPQRFGDESDDSLPAQPPGAEDQDLVVHNSYLEILAESGVLALLAFLAFLGGTWRLLGRARRDSQSRGDTEGARLTTAMQGTLVVAIVSGLFLSEQLTTPFWLIGALATAVGGTDLVARRRARAGSRLVTT
ncbi:MAG: O-antigen ligase family protein [Actinomycetota bacterium]|nr:O-antigen ligase family protein [Actinomycetota bacterium]